MDIQDIRFEALKLAQANCSLPGSRVASQIIEDARAYTDFVTGRTDAEIVDGVRELAKRAG